MSIAGLASTALFSLLNNAQSTQNRDNAQGTFQQIQSEFQQLGQDLQAGNLSQAQQDYATLSQDFSQANRSGSSSSENPIAQAFGALSKDLQNGNLSPAQCDYSTIQQDTQQRNPGSVHGHDRHNGIGQQQPIGQAFSSLASALQSDNLSSAQSAFAALEQDLGSFDSTRASSSSNSSNERSSSASQSGSTFSLVV